MESQPTRWSSTKLESCCSKIVILPGPTINPNPLRIPRFSTRSILFANVQKYSDNPDRGGPVCSAQNPAVSVNFDVNANRHPISLLVYGLNVADGASVADLNTTLNRYGGNNTSRTNWQQNADNRGFDWYFESVPLGPSTPGEAGDNFISSTKAAGAQSMMTIPIIHWVAKLDPNRNELSSLSIAKYGAQTDRDWQWRPDAGNGVRSGGGYVTGNDPNDANIPNNPAFQQQWVQHLLGKWGGAANGGLKYYILDNEHSLWFSTHRDVHPTGPSATEIRDLILDYSGKIKAVDPNAQVVGPEEWGWSGFIFSGLDQQTGASNNWSYFPDRRTVTGGMDYLPWMLKQFKDAGRKPLDVFSVHYYPQGGEYSSDVSTNMQWLRNRSTRSLWDPIYKDPTWINDYVRLVPRLKEWVNTYYYAGTPVAITEYSWGADNHINGATAQADILGIFGREHLDLATRWTTPASTTPSYKAIKMYRNYDGNKSTFGDTSVAASVPNPDNLSAFAATRTSDGALTVNGGAQVYQLPAANSITRLADTSYSGGALTATVPAQSITLFVLPPSGGNRSPNAVMTASPVSGTTPLTVSFNGTGSSDPDGTIASYEWQFGNGASATGSTATYTYTSAGSYTATKVIDNSGVASMATTTITVSTPVNKPPTAVMSATPISGNAPLTVAFNAAGSSDPDGSIASYQWQFGNGSTATGSSANYTYTTPGTYTATLKVTDNAVAISAATKTITVTGQAAKSCAVKYVNTNDWGNGFLADLTVTNTGSTAIDSWTLTWQFGGNQKITNLWNGVVTQSGKSVTVKNASWDGAVNPGTSVALGFVADYSGANAIPTVTCTAQ